MLKMKGLCPSPHKRALEPEFCRASCQGYQRACLDTAVRLYDPWLQYLKVFAGFDPLRKEPCFQAIERELNFPN